MVQGISRLQQVSSERTAIRAMMCLKSILLRRRRSQQDFPKLLTSRHPGIAHRQQASEVGQGHGRVASRPQSVPVRGPHRPDPPGIRAHYRPRRGRRHRHRAGRLHAYGHSGTGTHGHRYRNTHPDAHPGSGRLRNVRRPRERTHQLRRRPSPRYSADPSWASGPRS